MKNSQENLSQVVVTPQSTELSLPSFSSYRAALAGIALLAAGCQGPELEVDTAEAIEVTDVVVDDGAGDDDGQIQESAVCTEDNEQSAVECSDVDPTLDDDEDGLNAYDECRQGSSDQHVDTDGDNLSDLDESIKHTNPTCKDTDGDGLNDNREVNLGTDPLVADTDGDGLSDLDEIQNGTDPLNKDTDEDGFSDYCDSNPTNASDGGLVDVRVVGHGKTFRAYDNGIHLNGTDYAQSASAVAYTDSIPYKTYDLGTASDEYRFDELVTTDGKHGSIGVLADKSCFTGTVEVYHCGSNTDGTSEYEMKRSRDEVLTGAPYAGDPVRCTQLTTSTVQDLVNSEDIVDANITNVDDYTWFNVDRRVIDGEVETGSVNHRLITVLSVD